ncbi:hypothetical protein PQQ81_11030 [Paraburkholderia strydomiana]|uniref:hypothetical protein n=1 Tax=Paraburkholderia strydomiana TaxID=1245417 RepID=UPI0038BDBAE2
MKKIAFTTALLAAVLGQSTIAVASASCAIAGHYEGSYSGDLDHGVVVAEVDATDGTLTGKARSAVTGQTFAVGGVLNDAGYLAPIAAGSVSSGAAFSGRFIETDTVAGGSAGAGQWTNSTSINGIAMRASGAWGVERTSHAAGCR